MKIYRIVIFPEFGANTKNANVQNDLFIISVAILFKDRSDGKGVLLQLLAYVQICNQHGANVTVQNADENAKALFDLTKSPMIEHELRELIKKGDSQLQHTLHDEIDGFHIDPKGKYYSSSNEFYLFRHLT